MLHDSFVRLLRGGALCLVGGLGGCDPTPYTPPAGVVATDVVDVTPRSPSPSFRLVVRLSAPLGDGGAVRVALIEGEADEATVEAFGRGRPTASQRARELPTRVVPDGATLYVQPVRAAEAGAYTLVVVLPGRPATASRLTVVGEGPPARAYPRVGSVLPGAAVTHCAAGPLPPTLPSSIEWLGLDGRRHEGAVVARTDVPCVELTAPDAEGTFLPPPSVGALALDPAPVVVDDRSPRPPGGCAEPWSAIVGGLCLRVDDDRVVLSAEDPAQLLLATLDGQRLVAPLGTGARAWLRGLAPGRPYVLSGVLRGDADATFAQPFVTAPRRRHVVVNEVLARPPSGAATQRWVELGNDGDVPVDLLDLVLLDGVERVALPATTLAPGALALVVAVGFSPGLAGDVAPAKGTPVVVVPTLRLTGDVALIERDGRRLSLLPYAGVRKNAARGRRALDVPDDAPEAFGWDLAGSASPGRPNQIGP